MIGKCKQWDAVDSDNLAKFWMNLSEVRAKINNEILPYGSFSMGHEAEEVLQILELASMTIAEYQIKTRLQAGKNER